MPMSQLPSDVIGLIATYATNPLCIMRTNILWYKGVVEKDGMRPHPDLPFHLADLRRRHYANNSVIKPASSAHCTVKALQQLVAEFPDVKHLSLQYCQRYSSGHLKCLLELKELVSLSINATAARIPSEGYAQLATLPNLSHFEVSGDVTGCKAAHRGVLQVAAPSSSYSYSTESYRLFQFTKTDGAWHGQLKKDNELQQKLSTIRPISKSEAHNDLITTIFSWYAMNFVSLEDFLHLRSFQRMMANRFHDISGHRESMLHGLCNDFMSLAKQSPKLRDALLRLGVVPSLLVSLNGSSSWEKRALRLLVDLCDAPVADFRLIADLVPTFTGCLTTPEWTKLALRGLSNLSNCSVDAGVTSRDRIRDMLKHTNNFRDVAANIPSHSHNDCISPALTLIRNMVRFGSVQHCSVLLDAGLETLLKRILSHCDAIDEVCWVLMHVHERSHSNPCATPRVTEFVDRLSRAVGTHHEQLLRCMTVFGSRSLFDN